MIDEINENELFYLICDKNEDAEILLYESISSYLKFLSYTYASVFLREDDIMSYGWQGVIEALDCYNPEFSVSFSSFVRNCIQRRIIDVRRRNSLAKHRALMLKVDFEDCDQYLATHYVADSQTIYHLLNEVNSHLETELKPKEWLIYQAYLKQSSAKMVAAELNLSVQTIYRAVNKAYELAKSYVNYS